jgi:hypothetical protein
MESVEIKNAVIEGTMLGYEDHGILTCMLHLNYGGSGQGFGGYALDSYDGNDRIGTAYGMEFVRRILKTVGVEKWEDLKRKHVRVKAEWGKVHSIGHIIEDIWFTPVDDMKDFIKKDPAARQGKREG